MSTICRPPRFVLTGDKGSGKTAFISSICGVSVLGASRCVTEWDISVGPWSAEIHISRESAILLTPQPKRTPFGSSVNNSEALEALIMSAQLATTNPRFTFEFLSKLDEADLRALQSRASASSTYWFDTIHITLRSPDVPFEMTLVDLPGVINYGSNADAVTDITLSHLKPLNSILIVMMPSFTFETSHATLNLVKQSDPQFLRTIGVLTKPDMVDDGWHRWFDIIDGREMLPYPLFCTYSVPGCFESLPPHRARLQELTFFDTTEPWSDLANRHVLTANAIIWAAQRLSHDQTLRSCKMRETLAVLQPSRETQISISKLELGIFVVIFVYCSTLVLTAKA